MAFLLTESIEVPLYLYGMRGDSPLHWRLAAAFGASAVTHPAVWFVFPALSLPYWAYFAIAETFAVVVEWLYLRAFGVPNALLLSLLANATSAGVGLILHALR